MSDPARLAKLRFRAWHRGTREMDYICGCFFDRFHGEWSEAELTWFETLLHEIGRASCRERVCAIV